MSRDRARRVEVRRARWRWREQFRRRLVGRQRRLRWFHHMGIVITSGKVTSGEGLSGSVSPSGAVSTVGQGGA